MMPWPSGDAKLQWHQKHLSICATTLKIFLRQWFDGSYFNDQELGQSIMQQQTLDLNQAMFNALDAVRSAKNYLLSKIVTRTGAPSPRPRR